MFRFNFVYTHIKFYWFVMKIKKFMLPIWWYNRGWFPLGNKYLGSSFWIGWIQHTRFPDIQYFIQQTLSSSSIINEKLAQAIVIKKQNIGFPTRYFYYHHFVLPSVMVLCHRHIHMVLYFNIKQYYCMYPVLLLSLGPCTCFEHQIRLVFCFRLSNIDGKYHSFDNLFWKTQCITSGKIHTRNGKSIV